MKTTVVTGLLGSGKTTFLRNFLKDGSEKAVVLVNDFGSVGIDGEIIAAGGIETLELPGGCVCCTLKFDLITSIRKAVLQFAPDHLLIEPSGIASPFGVLEAVESAEISPPVVVGIVDAVEFADLYGSGMYGSFLREQIESADTVLVNKVDSAEREAIEAAERLVGEINPRAVLIRTVNAAMDVPLQREKPGSGLGRGLSTEPAHCRFETHSFTLPNGLPVRTFIRFFDDLSQGRFGAVARAKALVEAEEGPYRFDSVYGKVDRVRFDHAITDSRLVVIGADLRPDELRRGLPGAGPA